MSLAWQNPSVPLGVRCVLFAEREKSLGRCSAPYPEPNTSPDVRRYLAPCVRDVDSDGSLELLGLTAGNWCAAFAAYCLDNCILPGEERPHLYRAGVVEMVADARALGRWHGVSEVRDGLWAPSTGDLAVWDRSKPGRPETAWWRHVNRVTRYQPIDGKITTIGGNEGRAIRITDEAPKRLADSKLLGFISYAMTGGPVQPEEREQDLAMIAAFVEQHRRKL